ncbi:MAG: hypothetical protein ABI658_28500 [Acidimicrobiales bacterium]
MPRNLMGIEPGVSGRVTRTTMRVRDRMAKKEAEPTASDNRTTEDDSAENDKPGLRQRLHWATDDRDGEAKALADRAGEEVDEDAARLAVGRAHGEVRDGKEPEKEDDLATADAAKDAAQDVAAP